MVGKHAFLNACVWVLEQWPCHGFKKYVFIIFSDSFLTTEVMPDSN